MLSIENDFLKVTAENFVGELTSIVSKKTGKHYLFDGDKKHWGYHAPILFPIVCGLVDGKYRHNGAEYSMTNHGFIRASTFKTIEHTADKIVLELTENDDTLKIYPFKFKLTLTYTLNGNAVDTAWEVENTDGGELYFSTGGHPALSCPFNEGESFEDCYLEFEQPETASRMIMAEEPTYYMSHAEEPYLNNETKMPLNTEMFSHNAIVLKNLRSEKVMLKSKKSDNYVAFSIDGFPLVGFWTKPEGAPFVCIEPWHGHADYEDFTGELKDKAGIVRLAPGGKFNCHYAIEIFE